MFRVLVRSTPVVAAGALAVALLGSSARGLAAAPRQAASADAAPDPDQVAALLDEGQVVYGTNCLQCHMPGGAGPSLNGDSVLANENKIIRQILKGSANGEMPAFRTLTDLQIAGVATFIRNTWDNAYGVVRESDVNRVRVSLENQQ